MRRARSLPLLVLLAAPAATEVYDCAEDASRAAFRRDLAALASSNREFHNAATRRPVDGPSGGSLRCTTEQWCLYQYAKVKIAPPVISIQSAPASPCRAPWSALCSGRACAHRTAPLDPADAGSVVAFVRPAGGKVVLSGAAPSASSPFTLETEGVPGVAFDAGGARYRVQFGTRYIFREGDRLLDTGVTLEPEVLDAICGDYSALGCDRYRAINCQDLGLTKRGRRFVDARRRTWQNNAGNECVPR